MTLEELKTKKIAILGLGVNNRRLAEYLKKKKIGFAVFENWKNPAELAGHLDSFEIVFRTPGLPYLTEAIQKAKTKGVLIYSQTKLFFDLCPVPIIGVTGTKGKGTTATLLSKILEAAGKKNWLAGNIGQDPFEFLDEVAPADLVILELSSFQLQDLHTSPHIAVVLKITPEHLDHHRNLQEYVNAKKPIIARQTPGDFAILNYDQEVTRGFAPLTAGHVVWNSLVQEVKPGAFVKDDEVMLNWQEKTQTVVPTASVKLLGRFNLENVTAAVAAAAAAGVTDIGAIAHAVKAFPGLPHRLELVAEVRGVRFYNDSFATTPETTIAALTAFDSPVILIVGGSEKNSDYQGLAKFIASSRVKVLLPIGITGAKIVSLARAAEFPGRIIEKELGNMGEIVAAANEAAEPGDVVLLSPASASFDMFKNYKHRGELFKKMVNRL